MATTRASARHAPAPEKSTAPGAVERVYREMRARILDNVWPPGYQALEQALALELGVSRTPVREALIRLHNEGLIEVVPRHGMRVLPVSPMDMAEIYAILTSLESLAAELAARRKPSAPELAPLESACRDMVTALAADDLDAWAKADERFHLQLVSLCGNRRLAEVVTNFWERAHRARMVTLRMRPRPTNSTREHRAVMKAIRAGDAAAAAALHRAHRQRGALELTEILKQFRLTSL
jgi:DNA-binding GntR family transcriptional regulator